MSTHVHLRKKLIAGGKKLSLYLDFHPPIRHPKTGENTRREFLGRYLTTTPADLSEMINKQLGKLEAVQDEAKNKLIRKTITDLKALTKTLRPLTNDEKQANKEAIEFAQLVKRKRENELAKPEIYDGFELERVRKQENGRRDFVEYFRALANKRSSSTHDNWISALKYLEQFTGGRVTFQEMNEAKANEFKAFLLSTHSRKSKTSLLSQNSAQGYFNKVKAALKQAYKDGLIDSDINGRIDPIKGEETIREFLTIEELNKLAQTDCKNPVVKRAALFQALTGLRFSDVSRITWEELIKLPDQGYYLRFRQYKTKRISMLPISDQAAEIAGNTKEPQELIFKGLKYSDYCDRYFLSWILGAGIKKNVTSHTFRHSYAVNQLAVGTDIYTVSKLLGHKDLKTTQVYAKVLDNAKREAANRLKLDM
jgi:site-specific recombinase XerD